MDGRIASTLDDGRTRIKEAESPIDKEEEARCIDSIARSRNVWDSS